VDTNSRRDNGRLTHLAAKLAARLRAGVRDESGATAVFFAIGLILLAPVSLGLVDVYLTSTTRAQLQDALDTAALYAARSGAATTEEIDRIGEAALRANLHLPAGVTLVKAEFVLTGAKITGAAEISPPGIAPAIWDQANVKASTEILRSSQNLEVALVLDTTGSMSNEMANMRAAANELVGIVVQDVQTPYYSKLAIIPYSVGVNLASDVNAARGAIRGPTVIDAVTVGTTTTIKSTAHGLKDKELVALSTVNGVTRKIDGTTYNLNHEYTITRIDSDHFSLDGLDTTGYKAYSSGGSVQCLSEDCKKFKFKSASNKTTYFYPSSCVTERIGDEAYTDAAPETARVGRHYAVDKNGNKVGVCNVAPLVPLSSDKPTLTGAINALTDNGSTAGQIGLAWGWYAVSPDFKSLWKGTSEPAPYDKPELLKVVILMTDGAFNTPYCQGVVAQNAGSGSGGDDQHINCAATNGNPFDQADKLCVAMKEKGVIVYTVGFNVGTTGTVAAFMKKCATSPEHAYLPKAGGTALKDAFKAIAQDINSLRISK
jgi:Flp pilus assembly protein TadG